MDLTAWDGASSGLLDADDIALVAAETQPGGLTAVLVFENVWLHGIMNSWADSGARMILDGAISPKDLLEALDATDDAET